MNIIKQVAECSSCGGTGIYVGMGERDGFGVVCNRCEGTGEETIIVKWEHFTGRKRKKGVSRVVKVNAGICLGSPEKYDFGGMPYDDWFEGKKFPPKSEMRNFVCPAWWYQFEDYDKKPKWDKCTSCGSFSGCEHFTTKAKCWEQFDKEQNNY